MSKNINIMFYNSTVLRTCCLIITVLLIVCCASEIPIIPAINSIIIDSKICTAIKCKYQLKLTGEPYLGHYSWRLTNKEQLRGSTCDIFYPNYEVVEKYTSQKFTDVELTLSATSDKIYFCVHLPSEKSYFSKHWVHQGVNIFVQPIEPSKNIENNDLQQSQQVILEPWADLSHDTDVNYVPADHNVRPRANVEIYVNGQYVPANTVYRKKREVLKASIRNYVNVKNQSEISTKNLNITNLNKIYLEEKAKNKLLDNNVKEVLNNSNLNLLHILNNNTVLSVKEFLYNKSSVNTNHIVKNNTTDLSSHINVVKNDKVVNDTLKKQVQSIVQTEALNKSTINEDHINMMKELDVEENRSKLLSLNTLIPIKQKKTLTQQLKAENQLKEDNQNTKSNLETQVTHPGVIEVRNTEDMIEIDGLRLDKTVKGTEILDDGVPSVLATSPMTLRLFGKHLTERTVIVFTNDKLKYGQPCKFFFNGEYKAKPGAVTAKSAIFEVKAPPLLPDSHNFLYICAKNLQPGKTITEDDGKYYHMGTDTFVTIAIHEKILPVWASIIIILTCLTFSALFSGLNIGLMALDRTELKIIANAGTDEEKKYAKVIIPVRDNGNYLLCSILLGNVLVNSIFTILLDDLTSGLFAIIVSTIAIVILGEIAPQAICSRYGLMVGAKSIYITKFVMGVVGPMAYPMGKLLDYLLGEEIGNVYNRDRLKELVKLGTGQNDLDKEEINIISGALEMRKKTVAEVMTKLEDVFMLPITSVLDFETMSEMIQSGYSRIPVYEGKKNNIITVLFIKDLAFVDPDDNTPLRTICQYYQNPCNFVFEDVTLDIMFKQFKDGRKGHMAFVHRINSEGDGDPFYETIGLVTLEDVIEEMIQAEILDETDVFLDNRSKRRRRKQDFASFAERHENQRVHVSPQLIFATFQFMSTSVDAFKPDTVSENVLRRLLKQNIIQVIKTKGKDKNCPEMYIYQQGKPTDYFALILEGRVEVTVGRENLVFEAGPFTYFGEQALTQNINICDTPSPSKLGSIHNLSIDVIARNTFVPDYSVRAITETFYLIVKRSMYLAAKRATLMEKGALTKGTTSEQFDTEVDKLFASSEDDMSGGGDQKSRQVSPKTNPLPLRAIPSSPDRIRDNYRRQSECDEQEKLLKS